MKIKTNLRAGKGQNQNGKTSTSGADNPVGSEDPVVVPVSRCPGY